MSMKERYINVTTIIFIFIFILFIISFIDFRSSKKGDSFAEQYYTSTIASIELHKIRYGEYPKNLKELKFFGKWTSMGFRTMEYRKVDNGYTLVPTMDESLTKAILDYPDEFYQGLGVLNRANSPSIDHSFINMEVMNFGE